MASRDELGMVRLAMNDILLEKLRWRYAAKAFDSEKKIPSSDWETLEEILRLTPSSYGMQPWKFFVITDQVLKESLVEASYNQGQVANCSHLLVFTVPKSLSEADVDKLIETTCKARDSDPGSLDFYKKMIMGDIVEGPRSNDIAGWAKLQTYIALGNLMTCAALLGVDCCPMEGFSPDAYDKALNLDERDLTTAVVCPCGYRSNDDKYASAPKVRYPKEDLFEYL